MDADLLHFPNDRISSILRAHCARPVATTIPRRGACAPRRGSLAL